MQPCRPRIGPPAYKVSSLMLLGMLTIFVLHLPVSLHDAVEQIQSVNNFAKMKGLKLCPEKWGEVINGRHIYT